MRDTLIVINSFVHDVATGAWVSSLVMMITINNEVMKVSNPELFGNLISRLQEKLFFLALASFVIIMLTGIIRGFTFRYYGWTGDVAKDRKKLLMIKHIILGVVFLVGLYYQFKLWYFGLI
ncbi:MAG: hypothetical protein ACYDG6_13090 [Thermincolia bacterium]